MENVVNVEQQNQTTRIQEMDKTTQTMVQIMDKTMEIIQIQETTIAIQILETQVENHFHKQEQVAL